MGKLLIENASVFDGQVFLPGHYSIILNDEKIEEISPSGKKFKDKYIQVINANGNTVMPALHEGHCHFMAHAWQKHSVNLCSVLNIQEAEQIIKQYLKKIPANVWVRGGGWSLDIWGKENINKAFLDKIFPNNPVALESQDFHSVWINSAAQKLLNIPNNPANTKQKIYGKDEHGDFNGILFERARDIIYKKIPDPSTEWIRESLDKSIQDWWQYGFTSCTGMEQKKDISYFSNYLADGGKFFRLSWFCPYTMLDELLENRIISGMNYMGVKLCGIKLFADGSFGSQTAQIYGTYKNSTKSGVEVMEQKHLANILFKAHKNKIATSVHAIGDLAIDRVLAAYATSVSTNDCKNLRNRMEHVQIPTPQAISNIKQFNLGIAMQPYHIKDDIDIIHKTLPDKKPLCYPFKTLIKKQIPLIMSSDAPVVDPNPWQNIYLALTQKDPSRNNKKLNTKETLTLAEALNGYTETANYYGYQDKLGQIKRDYYADIIVLNKNLSRIENPEKLLQVKTETTISNGKIVFQR